MGRPLRTTSWQWRATRSTARWTRRSAREVPAASASWPGTTSARRLSFNPAPAPAARRSVWSRSEEALTATGRRTTSWPSASTLGHSPRRLRRFGAGTAGRPPTPVYRPVEDPASALLGGTDPPRSCASVPGHRRRTISLRRPPLTSGRSCQPRGRAPLAERLVPRRSCRYPDRRNVAPRLIPVSARTTR